MDGIRGLYGSSSSAVMFSYSFREVTLEPGAEEVVKVDVKSGAVFRAQRLVMVGSWDVVRGWFKLKRSRLPLLDRDDMVAAYSKITWYRRGKKIWYRKGRTTIEFRGNGELKPFVRTYLPSSVVYIHTDPLHLIQLRNLFIGHEPQLAGSGVPATWFNPNVFGNSLPMPSSQASISLHLKNVGDVQIRVRAMLFGAQFDTNPNGGPK